MKSLRVRLDRSPFLERLGFALHVLAVLCTWLSGIPWVWKLGLTAAIVLTGWLEHGRRHPELLHLCYSDATGWTLDPEARDPEALTILPGSVLTPWVVVLHARAGRRTRHWVIARDSVDAESFRRLRVCLRVQPVLAGRAFFPFRNTLNENTQR